MAEYIEREALLNRLKTKVKRITPIEESRDMFYHDSGVNGALTRAMLEAENAPAADVVPVVRCKDCRYSRGLNEKERLCVCDNALICKNSEAHVDGWNPVWPDDFCSYGEKKEAEGNG